MELSRILERLLGTGAVLDKDLVDAEVGVVYTELVHPCLVIRFYIAFKLSCPLKQIHFLVKREIIYYGKTSAFECVHIFIIKLQG